mmetsp:Transcript_7275/g.16761  ORF Transcript_7275/g.16761 Transcript_7275/m.16761 type:complete len:200 (+) Transcript_7275:994-1593(+)
MIDEVAGVEIGIHVAEVRLCLEGLWGGAHVDSDGRASGEVLGVDVEEGVHVGRIRDEPLQLEVLVDLGGTINTTRRETGKEQESHSLPHWGGHIAHEALETLGEVAAFKRRLREAAAQAAALRILNRALGHTAAAAAVDESSFGASGVQSQAWQEDRELEGVAQDNGDASIRTEPAQGRQDSGGANQESQCVRGGGDQH